MPKYVDIASTIDRRIKGGDYAISQLPSERLLAAEMGVSYMTARRAVQHLLDNGVLLRQKNGRLDINRGERDTHRGVRVAILIPDWNSPAINIWRKSLEAAAKSAGMSVRSFVYQHPDDPVIFDTLGGDFSLVFFHMSSTTPAVERRLALLRDKAISFFNDLTHLGVRLVDGAHGSAVSLLVEHLHELGHREVAFYNFEPYNSVLEQRCQAWEHYTAQKGMHSVSHHLAVEPFTDPRERAYVETARLLKKGRPSFTAAFVTTVATAQGMIRAFHEAGCEVGRDVSLCSFGESRAACWLIPSLTVVGAEGYDRLFAGLFADYSPELGWLSDRLEFRLEGVRLYPGESTAAVVRGG